MKPNNKAFLEKSIGIRGKIVSPSEASECLDERMMIKIIVEAAKLAGAEIYPVKWDDGVLALVPGDPTNIPAWQQALIRTHRHAVAGTSGPVDLREQA